MGCTPSIHVSQTGVVYCRDTDEANNLHALSSPATNHQLHGHCQVESTKAGTSGPRVLSVAERGSRKTPGIEVETQTIKDEPNEVKMPFGPMVLYQKKMQILLVFSKDDAQSDGLCWAARKGGYFYDIVKTPEHALQCYLDHHHDIVIIDHRHSHKFDPSSLCKSLRCSSPNSNFTVFIAVIRKGTLEDVLNNPSLQDEEFDRRIVENSTPDTCLNELLMLEKNDFRSKLMYRACKALCSALDNCSEAVKITSENRKIQYVNAAHERLTGFTCEELLGTNEDDLLKGENNNGELTDSIQNQLKTGKHWEGTVYTKRKHGDSIPHMYLVTPILDDGGRYNQYVAIRRLSHDHSGSTFSLMKELDVQNDGFSYSRRQSIAKIHLMTEAPITKVINIINNVQKNSPFSVVQTLDKVLEILRTAELYCPQLPGQQTPNDDQMTSDLVGGLMSAPGTLKMGTGRRQSSFDMVKGQLFSTPLIPLSQCPANIKKLLEKEAKWDFDILELERISNKRPLVWIGMKILSRFGALQLLSCSEQVLRNWLQVIEANYHSTNTYHNSTHAADVLQATSYFLDKEKMKLVLDPMDEIASLLAAIVHDVDHPGRTNSFLCNAQSDLALLYNDMAVLESHHAALTFKITASDERINILRNLEREDYRAIRQTIIDMVLATEMTKHFEHLSKFSNSINKPVKDEENRSGDTITDNYLNILSSPENRKLIRRMIIKCADVSNPVRPINLCKEWAFRIAQEYFCQTDEEKSRNLPVVMPVFDRNTCSIPKSQTSFIDYFIIDMFNAWDAFLHLPEIINIMNENYQYWKLKEDKDKEAQVLKDRQKRESLMSQQLEFSLESRKNSSDMEEIEQL